LTHIANFAELTVLHYSVVLLQAAQTALQDLQRRIAKSDAEIERFKGVEAYLKQQLQTMEGVIGTKNTEIETLQRDLEANKTSYEEKVVFLQMQMAGAKVKDEERGKDTAAHRALVDKLTAQITALQRMIEEKDLSYKSNKDMIQALQSRLIEMEPELAASRDKVAQFERNASAQVGFSMICISLADCAASVSLTSSSWCHF
jgi:chromosome segregation ATPase